MQSIFELKADYEYTDFVLDEADEKYVEELGLLDGSSRAYFRRFRVRPNPDAGPKPFPDYAGLYGGGRGLFSCRARSHLDGILRRFGQLFPVDCDVKEYFLYNVTTVVDALDRDHSRLEYFPQLRREKEAGLPLYVRMVFEYWFHEDRLAGVDIFKLPEFNETRTYVSERFVQTVSDGGLTGFSFEKVWSSGDPKPDLRPRRLPG